MRRHTPPWAVLAGLALAASPGCHERDPGLDEPLSVLPPVSVGGGLLYVERAGARAFFLDLAAATPTVRAVPLGAAPELVEPRATAAGVRPQEALVLSRGSRGETGTRPEPGTLTVVSSERATAPRRYTVGSPFNAVAQTPDGRYAFAYFRPESAQGRLLYNPNEVALVDLAAPPGAGNPVTRTVRSFGGVPNAVVFSPPLTLHGEARVLALVLSDAYVTVLDLAHQDRPEVTVRLTLPEDPRAVGPTQVVFDAEAPAAYVRAAASDDVYVLQFGDATAPVAGGNDFGVTINQLAAGQRPADMALFGTGASRRLLVVSPGSRDARVIDARSNTITAVPLDVAADRVLLFEGPAPRDPAVAPRALLYATGSAPRAVSFLDLTDVESRRGRNVETLQLSRAVVAALPLPDGASVMLQHPPDGGSQGSLSLLDLARRTAAPIFAEVSLAGAAFDADRRTLWVAPQNSVRLGYIDLTTFHPGEVRLDAAVTAAIPLRGDPMDRNRVVAVHPGVEGNLTVLDSSDPSRDTALSYRAVVLSDLLARGTP